MKKYTLLPLFALSTSLFAADYTTLLGDVSLSAGGATVDKTVTINGAGKMTYASASDVFTINNVSATSNNVTITLIKATENYEFDGIVKITGAGLTGTGDQIWGQFNVANGKTLRIKNLQSDITSNARGFFKFIGASGTSDQTQYANIYVGTTQDNVFKNGKENEVWLNYVNFHAMSAPTGSYGYIHFQHGCNFICETDNIFISTIAVRQSFAVVRNRAEADLNLEKSFSGRIDLNGYSVGTYGLTFNPSDNYEPKEQRRCTDFYIDFGSSEKAMSTKQTFYIGSLSDNAGYSCLENNRVFVKNVSEGDSFIFGEWVDADGNDLTTKKIFDTTFRFEEGVEYEVSKITSGEYAGQYSLTIIPEPSTYAMIFGALALGFVVYRRRK